MPPPSSTQQKVLVAQFVNITAASERQATKEMKPKTQQQRSISLNDSLIPIEPGVDAKRDDKDKMELESTMTYLEKHLGVNLENAELFIALEIVKAPNLGEITRRGFVEGWLSQGAGFTIEGHAAHVQKLALTLSDDDDLFRSVYRHTFVAGRESDQKALGLENAVVYWTMLFSPPGFAWKSENHDWLDLWKSFLDEKWTRSVNKDMWNMTLEFALKSTADESLSFWTEDGAWPSVIDDFVEWCHAKGIGKSEKMEVEHDE
ncbi:hypothetical protein AAL_02183 [Moelleriella libera RCEF 2490]|uniref:Defective in cullin neddylation protein n=1 Tax=Moelleriella libera RCEF 2490 TaxID=1081109 RepID=A0A168F928_9HYPO|nr:hypothetical protein AAL_02183 [Moelleriella libera RCEF 2490]